MTATAVADHVDDDVFVELLSELVGQLGDSHAGLGVVSVDVEDRCLDHACHVGGVDRGARGGRRGGETDLVVDNHVDRAARAVAAQLGEVERLGHDTLTCERGVTVQQQRQDGVGRALQVQPVLLGACDALQNRVDGLEVGGVGSQVDLGLGTVLGDEHALGAEVVLHVARALDRRGVLRALELPEDLAVGLARDVGQHVEASTVRHPDTDLVHALTGGAAQDPVEHGDHGLATLQAEALLSNELGLQERLEGLGGVEPSQDPQLLAGRGLGVGCLDLGLDPLALLGVLDVHVLHANGAAVGIAQDAQNIPQLDQWCPAEAPRGEVALQIPQREAMGGHVEVGVSPLAVLQRVGVGHQVAAHAVGVDQLLHPGRLVDVLVVAGRDVLNPGDRLVGDPQRLEDLTVEVVLAQQKLVQDSQELAGHRALDDAVVIGRGDGDDLADGVAVQRLLARALPLGRVLQGPHCDDRALTGHQPGHGVDGAYATGVGQADRGAYKVVDGQLVGAGLADHFLIGRPEVRKVHRLGRLDGGHEQGAGAIGFGHVDGKPQVDVGRGDQGRFAILLPEAGVHLRHQFQRLDEGVSDQVGEADLAASAAPQMVVDDNPVVDEELGRHDTHAGRGRHAQAGFHVGHRASCSATQWLHVVLAEWTCGLDRRDVSRLWSSLGSVRGWLGDRCRRCGGPNRCRGGGEGLWFGDLGGACTGFVTVGASVAIAVGGGVVVREELPPCLVHRVLVLQVLLVELSHEPLVGAEVGHGIICGGLEWHSDYASFGALTMVGTRQWQRPGLMPA